MCRYYLLRIERRVFGDLLGNCRGNPFERLMCVPGLVQANSPYKEIRHAFNNFEVCGQCLFQHNMPEQSSVRNIPHEQLYHHKVFVYCLVESWSGFWRRCASDRLLQIGMRFRVVELYSSDTTEIVVVSRKL